MRLIDADAMLLKVDLIGTNKFGMLDEDIRKFISEQPTVDMESVSPVDWSKIPVDTPILVRDDEDNQWLHRHFAEYKNGFVYAWTDGYTSWSAKDTPQNAIPWIHAELAEESEQR